MGSNEGGPYAETLFMAEREKSGIQKSFTARSFCKTGPLSGSRSLFNPFSLGKYS